MKQKYITLDKMSKKARKDFYSSLRGTWGELSPVTRKIKNGKAYNRNKIKRIKNKNVNIIVACAALGEIFLLLQEKLRMEKLMIEIK